ncbi:MAG: hypothetical protein KAJ98_08450 [Spirochaetaceae bacterium]|nr:hypothetical protein [Spirochaetaceae bacterium]
MFSPGVMFGVVLLLLSACILPALEISLDASIRNDRAVVSGRIDGFQSNEIIRLLDSGSTVRLTWVFRLAGSDETIVRYAHRDPLGEGYLIYGADSESGGAPVDVGALLEELSFLDDFELSSLGPWEPDESLKGRLFLDRDLMLPPMSITSFFGRKQDRSSWSILTHPLMEAE